MKNGMFDSQYDACVLTVNSSMMVLISPWYNSSNSQSESPLTKAFEHGLLNKGTIRAVIIAGEKVMKCIFYA